MVPCSSEIRTKTKSLGPGRVIARTCGQEFVFQTYGQLKGRQGTLSISTPTPMNRTRRRHQRSLCSWQSAPIWPRSNITDHDTFEGFGKSLAVPLERRRSI